jgi:succinate dehydrogenase hydrophobic anchor subunit
MKYPCNVIRDLIPLYYDQVCSEESAAIVKEHLDECSDCKEYYDELCNTETIEKNFYDKDIEKKKSESFKSFSRKVLKRAVLIVSGIVMSIFILGVILLLLLHMDLTYNKNDYSKIDIYDTYRNEVFTDNMKEIWPEGIDSTAKVTEYRFIDYYDDATAYTGYLSVTFGKDAYDKEAERLKAIDSTDYLGKYENTGFGEYSVLAIRAHEYGENVGDGYYGFTYALTGGDNEIIYVELEYPRENPRDDYKKIIPENYLPSNMVFEKDVYPLYSRILWGLIPSIIALACLWIGIKNINQKRWRGILQIVFAVMLVVFGMLNAFA